MEVVATDAVPFAAETSKVYFYTMKKKTIVHQWFTIQF